MSIEAQFQRAMSEIYTRARTEVRGYNPSGYLRMLADVGALGTARQLLNSSDPAPGFTTLWDKRALHLSVEALVIQPEWQGLFTEEELRTARKRLRDYGFEEPALPPVHTEDIDPHNLMSIANAINRRAENHRIGKLQERRKLLKKLHHTATSVIFGDPKNAEYVFHSGGRSELQFNIGFEPRPQGIFLRHGVAFSLEPSQSLQQPVETLLPKIQRFNEYFQEFSGAFAEMALWLHTTEGWSPDYSPRKIEAREAVSGNFIFLGHRYAPAELKVDQVLTDFDRLLELYEFVEAIDGVRQHVGRTDEAPFQPGHRSKVAVGTATITEQTLSIEYRHNVMQDDLYDLLSREFGPDRVMTEWAVSPGVAVDIAVQQHDAYWFYEIKTAPFARSCVRQGLSQLLEYSYWPGAPVVTRLVLVGEPAADKETRTYLTRLREFGIPLYYQQYVAAERRLQEPV